MTNEQREARERFTAQVGSNYRIDDDSEGWPIVPGRYGRIEWYDGEQLACYTDHRLIRGPLLKIPDVRQHQAGDTELRALFPSSALPAVAKVVRARRRFRPSRAQLENLVKFTKQNP